MVWKETGKLTGQKPNSNGYKRLRLNKHLYYAHRVVWYLHYKDWPKGQIDHINGIRDDNRIENLRDVSLQDNRLNQKLNSKNTSGHMGVSKHTKGGYQTHIYKNKKRFTKYFSKLEDAIEWRKQKETELGYHPNHGRKQQ